MIEIKTLTEQAVRCSPSKKGVYGWEEISLGETEEFSGDYDERKNCRSAAYMYRNEHNRKNPDDKIDFQTWTKDDILFIKRIEFVEKN